jgi:hypothetical protein
MYYIERKMELFDLEDLENNLPKELCHSRHIKIIMYMLMMRVAFTLPVR